MLNHEGTKSTKMGREQETFSLPFPSGEGAGVSATAEA